MIPHRCLRVLALLTVLVRGQFTGGVIEGVCNTTETGDSCHPDGVCHVDGQQLCCDADYPCPGPSNLCRKYVDSGFVACFDYPV